MKDLRELPKVRDSWSYLYLDRCKVEQDEKSISFFDNTGKTPVPCASLSLLMLGPGSNISHAAIKTLAENGVTILWTGENGVRMYAQGMGETRSSGNLLRQAKMVSNPTLRLGVVRKLYEVRFEEELAPNLTLEQIRGLEGIRVREAYRKASQTTGVEWKGRSYKQSSWKDSDPVNRALSTANSCLYGVCHGAIVALGLSPGLGFVHTGQVLSFVYDIGDLYKTQITIPAAFDAVSKNPENLEREVRVHCRDYFKETRFLAQVVKDIQSILGLYSDEEIDQIIQDTNLEEGKGGRPCKLWDDKGAFQPGGRNWGEETNQEMNNDGHDDS